MRSATDALNRRDFGALAEIFHEDVEHHSIFGAMEGEVYRGIEGQRRRMANVERTWDAFSIAVEEVSGDGDETTVVLRLTGVAHGSGLPLDARLTQVWAWRDGKVTRIVTGS